MISVVLCCYNGEKYIEEQLKSIYHQSKMVDEVIIYDDGSSDNTIPICENFIIDKKLNNNWKLIKNNINRGVYSNFIQGCIEASGNIIFLSDQDDIWHYNKVEIMSKYFEENNKILSLATSFKNIDQYGNIISDKIRHPYRNNGQLRKIKFEEYLKFNNYLGMTMALKKSIIDDFSLKHLEYEKRRKQLHPTHDITLNFYSVLHDGMYFLDQELVTRRTHLESVSNMNNPTLQSKFFNENETINLKLMDLKMYILAMEWFLILLDNKCEKEKSTLLRYYDFYKKRYSILSEKQIFKLGKLVAYIDCYKTPVHYMKDIIYIFKNK